MAFRYRVIAYYPDTGFGIAICTDEFNARKITVRDENVISGKLQIASLIECEIEKVTIMRGKPAHRYSGKAIQVLR